ncbi:Hypothetical protein HVIM_02499 [Roseomonas mucosa]|uniref:Uncharacterized protein n=1 Tax=Roseomonas mucosa TaxID=207340 RepID=A0A1S8DAL2_9PROT|nr:MULTISPECIES: hypothetical protein [Roseomonas]MBS5904325.1 hypothetical protein [Acetobacteraceae bacterium]MCG7351310.1 hypothetical protein [Roseomonas mucosa]MCG7356890.1 hypothetical protein [Roseomonas mucosa]MDT8290988.1 hypothetical protein [Roseomonas mucosa]MDT8295354.1 hypothetical protein [Roseomonas mucosa]
MRSFRILTSLLLFGGSPSLAAMTPWQDVHAAKPDRPAPEAAPLAVPDRLALAAVPWSASLPENLPALEQERAALQERLAQIGLTIDRILAGVVMTARKADPWGPARESDPAPLLEALGQERQLILDRLGQVDRKSLLLATTTSLPARAAPRDPDADLLAGTDPAPGQEDAETPEALMARVDRLGAAMDRLLASIEAPPESQERGGASGEELLKRLYALRDAQTRLLERIARIEAPPIPLPPPSPPEERLASAPSGDGPVLAPAPAADAAEEAAPAGETQVLPPLFAVAEPEPPAEKRLVEKPLVETPAQAPAAPPVLVAGPAVPPPPPSPVQAIAPSAPAALPVRDSAPASREARLIPALRCRILLQRAQLGEELTLVERKDLRGACVT